MNAPIDHRKSATCVKQVGNNIYGSGEEVREKLRITRQQMPLTITGEESLANHCILDEILSEKKKLMTTACDSDGEEVNYFISGKEAIDHPSICSECPGKN